MMKATTPIADIRQEILKPLEFGGLDCITY